MMLQMFLLFIVVPVSALVHTGRPEVLRVSKTQLQVGGSSFIPGVTCTNEKIGVVGATGYIGRYVVQECLRRSYPTVAVVRDKSNLAPKTASLIKDAEIREALAVDRTSLDKALNDCKVVICCLASRSGTKADSWMVDYEASVNCLEAARKAGARHMILLSAFCVRKPELEFQKAKLQTEAALAAQNDITYSIVRPTAFFKSLSGQVEILKGGGPFVFFDLGNGQSATCNPIAETDLASAIVDCIADPSRNSKTGNPIWNIGGPDTYSMKAQGELIADALSSVNQEARRNPWLLPVPIGIFDFIINIIDTFANLFDSEKVRDAAELARIGRYYAVENMLTTEQTDIYGTTSLLSHYERVAKEGQEYDPYTTLLGSKDEPAAVSA